MSRALLGLVLILITLQQIVAPWAAAKAPAAAQAAITWVVQQTR